MDFLEIAIQFIVSIRGNMSQNRFSNVLGYDYNIVHKWESKQNKILWSHFYQCCQNNNVPLKNIMWDMFAYDGDLSCHKELLARITFGKGVKEIAEDTNISYAKIYNWLSKDSSPPLDQLLIIFDHYSSTGLSQMLHCFNSLYPNEVFEKILNSEKQIKSLFLNKPKSALILQLLELKQFQEMPEHLPNCFAKILDISECDEQEVLLLFLENGLITFKNNKYELVYNKTISTLYSFAESAQIRNYWLKRAIQFNDDLDEKYPWGNMAGYSTLAFDSDSIKEVYKLTGDYFNQIRKLSENSVKKDFIRVLNIAFIDPIKESN